MTERTIRFVRRYWLAFAIVIAFVAMWGALWNVRYSRVAITTLTIAPALFGSPVSVLRIIGEEPVREEVWLDVPGGRGRLVADVYRPKDGDAHGAMVMSVGAAPSIRDHLGVVRLSTTAARASVDRLSPQARDIYDAFQDKDPDRILAFWGEMSPQDVATLCQVSPSSAVAALDTELFIMHDRSDPYVPYVESRRLRDAAAGNSHQVYFAEFDFLNHVELTKPSNPIAFLADLVKLIFYS